MNGVLDYLAALDFIKKYREVGVVVRQGAEHTWLVIFPCFAGGKYRNPAKVDITLSNAVHKVAFADGCRPYEHNEVLFFQLGGNCGVRCIDRLIRGGPS
jgi:hypothetical protein